MSHAPAKPNTTAQYTEAYPEPHSDDANAARLISTAYQPPLLSVGYCLKTYWLDYVVGLGTLLATNAMGALIPLRIKHVLDSLKANAALSGASGVSHLWHDILGDMAWIFGLVCVMFAVRVVSRYCLIGVGRKIEQHARITLYAHFLKMPRSFFDAYQTGDLMSRLTNDMMAFRMMLGGGVMLLANVFFAYVLILPMMCWLSIPLTCLAFGVYPLVVWIVSIISKRIKRHYNQVQDTLADITTLAQENFSGMSTIQAYAAEASESQHIKAMSDAYYKQNMALVSQRTLMTLVMGAVSGISILAVLGEGGREVIMGQLGVTGLIAFMLYLERLAWPTISLGWIVSNLQQGSASMGRLNQLLMLKPEVNDLNADPTMTTLPEGAMTLEDVFFRYDNTYGQTTHLDNTTIAPWVLNDISLTIPQGKTVAIVGPIGCGKSTLLQCLVRQYEFNDGTYRIGEVDATRIPLHVLRESVCLMPQHSFLFSESVHHNVAYVDPGTGRPEVEHVSQQAQFHNEVLRFDYGYDSLVGERGVMLSGGQRQRAALARTLLANPRFLLLDDPFSNLDTELEETIIQALNDRHRRSDLTTIVASQRFSFIRQADVIVVMNPIGMIEAIGSHDELIQRCALYRDLFQQAEQEAA